MDRQYDWQVHPLLAHVSHITPAELVCRMLFDKQGTKRFEWRQPIESFGDKRSIGGGEERRKKRVALAVGKLAEKGGATHSCVFLGPLAILWVKNN